MEIDLLEIIPDAIIKNLLTDITELDQFYNSSVSRYDKDYEELTRITNDIILSNKSSLDTIRDGDLNNLIKLNENFRIYTRSKNTRSHLLIVGTYMVTEKSIKEFFSMPDRFTNPELRSLFEIRKVEILIKDKFGVNIRDLNNYNQMNELRCLNNCIKHTGYPDTELIAINPERWKAKEEIENVYQDFIRLRYKTVDFCLDLFRTVKEKIREKENENPK